MGFTTVTHMLNYGPMSWSVLGPNIVWITGKTSFIHELKTYSGNQLQNNKENI